MKRLLPLYGLGRLRLRKREGLTVEIYRHGRGRSQLGLQEGGLQLDVPASESLPATSLKNHGGLALGRAIPSHAACQAKA